MVKSLFKKIICWFLPELKSVLYTDIAYEWITNAKVNVTTEKLTKIYSPHSLVKVKIGKGTYISANSKISYTTIGKFCSIGPNLVCGWGIHPINGISTSPYFYSVSKQNGATIADKNLIEERRQIYIGNDVFIGANVTILDGVCIADGAVIGAGAVVSKNIPAYAIAVGSPIEIKKYRFDNIKIKKLLKIKWWDLNDFSLNEINRLFFEVDAFIKEYDKDL
ncbi:MAG: chloramphenicol acetyltransferase [Kordia sp.]|nr:MAG: chloramphenicol acetyltransferase [Kordia sp.]